MLTDLLNALVPIFGGLLLGYVAGRRGSMDGGNVRNLIAFVMNIAVPCALISIIIGTTAGGFVKPGSHRTCHHSRICWPVGRVLFLGSRKLGYVDRR